MRDADLAAGLVGVGARRLGIVVPAYVADDVGRLVAGYEAMQRALRLDECRHGQAPLRSHDAPAVRPLSRQQLRDHAENARS